MVRGRSERPIGGELVALRRQKPQPSALVTARQGSTAERTDSSVLVEGEPEREDEATTPLTAAERPLMGAVLVEMGVVKQADVDAALESQPGSGLRIGEILAQAGKVD